MSENTAGLRYAVMSFVLWGVLPIYWKFMGDIPSHEILAHRVVWSMVFVYLILMVQGRLAELKKVFGEPSNLMHLAGTGFLIGINWFLYIWAVNSGMILETSMGYYICPMVSILLGFFFLKEKVRGLMIPAVFFAAVGIAVMWAGYGRAPFVGIALAVSFGFYGLFHKRIHVKPLPGLFVETLTLLPIALGYIIYLQWKGAGSFHGGYNIFMLTGSGVATSLPLLLFVAGAGRITLGTLGTLQYIAPTIAFMIGAFIYGEPLGISRVASFALIWCGVILYLLQLYRDTSRSALNR